MSIFKNVVSTIPSLVRDGGKRERVELQDAVREILPKHRASACLRHRLGSSSVTISTTNKGGTRLGGLMVCDAGHVCPVCHHRKMAQEQKVVSEIVHSHYQDGGILVDAVLTVSHQVNETFECVLARLETAWKSLRSSRRWRPFARELGIVGAIRRLEVTVGIHGWHPHFHVSFLCDPAAAEEICGRSWYTALNDAFAIVSSHWARAGEANGIPIAVNAQAAVAIIGNVDAQKAVSYNTKNMGYCEKENSLTPVDLLRIVAQVDSTATVSAAKRLFAEYAEAIKGKHILTFIGVAKEARATAVETAQSVCAETKSEQLGKLSGDAWCAIVKGGLRGIVASVKNRRELVAAVLSAAQLNGGVRIPIGWLRLAFESKSVMGSSCHGSPHLGTEKKSHIDSPSCEGQKN